MAIPFLQHINLNKNELQNAVIQNLGTAPGSPAEGQLYFDSTGGDKKLYFYNGSTWISTSGDISRVNITAGNGLSGTSVDTTTGEHTQTLTVGQGTGITITSTAVAVTAAQTGITSVINAALVVGRDADNDIDFATDNQIIFRVGGADGITMKASGEIEATKFDGALEGNADTATILATGRTIGMTGDVNWTSAAFDGSSTVTGTSTIQANAVEGSMLNTNVISGQTDLSSGIATADEILISDGGTLKKTGVDVLATYMQSALTFTTNTNTGADMTNATLLSKLAALESASGSADETITIGTDPGDTIVITGNLTVSGTTTTINTATVEVEDNILQLNTTQASPDTATAATSGISVYRGNGVTQASLVFDDGDDTWDLTNNLVVAGTITTTGLISGGSLDIDDVLIDGTTIGCTGDTDLMTLTSGVLTVAGEVDATSLDIGTGGADINGTLEVNAITIGGVTLQVVVEDHVGAMLDGTETGITVGYDATNNNLDFVVADTTVAGDTGSTGITPGDTLTIAGGANVATVMSGDTLTITGTDTNTQLATAAAEIDVSAMAGNNVASFTHSLTSKNLIVQLYDKTSGLIVHADVDHTSTDAISITFANTGAELVTAGIGDIRVVVIDAVHGVTDKTVTYS